jgi:hypothetical protein
MVGSPPREGEVLGFPLWYVVLRQDQVRRSHGPVIPDPPNGANVRELRCIHVYPGWHCQVC